MERTRRWMSLIGCCAALTAVSVEARADALSKPPDALPPGSTVMGVERTTEMAGTPAAPIRTQRSPTRAMPHARGGGPRNGASHGARCDGADRAADGHCAAPDLAPTPQHDQPASPRLPPFQDQNASGPTSGSGVITQ